MKELFTLNSLNSETLKMRKVSQHTRDEVNKEDSQCVLLICCRTLLYFVRHFVRENVKLKR